MELVRVCLIQLRKSSFEKRERIRKSELLSDPSSAFRLAA